MKVKRFRSPCAFLLALALISAMTPSAFAGWELGIIVPDNTVSSSSYTSNDNSPEKLAAEILQLINARRTENGASALLEHSEIKKLADIRARESSEYFSHKRPDGSSCSTIYSDYSITYVSIGENLAFGYSSPESLVAAWMASESHRQNILCGDFVYTGIGIYIDSNGTAYYSQLFFTPLSTKN
jgi:uncharacterized protein YkwD